MRLFYPLLHFKNTVDMKFFTFFLLFLLLFINKNQAQILFQDIADQNISLGQFLLLDVDNDGANDLIFSGNFVG